MRPRGAAARSRGAPTLTLGGGCGSAASRASGLRGGGGRLLWGRSRLCRRLFCAGEGGPEATWDLFCVCQSFLGP